MIGTNSSNQPLYLFDRSRIEDAAKCQRLYFWRYAALGIGIVPAREFPPAWALWTGTAIHEGIEAILKGVDPAEAARKAAGDYWEKVNPLIEGLEDAELKARTALDFAQQMDLVVGLVYGWGLVGMPRLMLNYDLSMLDIEREEQVGFLLGDPPVEVRLLARTDILARHKQSKQLHVINLKSISEPGKKWSEQWMYDMTTLTEPLAVEERIGEPVGGVVIEGLVKGSKKEYPPGSGFYQHNCGLIYSWVKELKADVRLAGEPEFEFYSKYEWTCLGPHTLGNGQKCYGGKVHRLSGARKRAVRDVYPGGIIAWVDHLAATDRETLESHFISLQPIIRDAFAVARWKRQVLAQEKARQDAAEQVNAKFIEGDKQAAYELLDYFFPMSTGAGNCIRPWECSYKKLCWEANDPFDDSTWKARVPNHPAEGELVQISLKVGE